MNALISRNLKLFFRDRMAVFFSLLSIIISISLYVLFLSDTMMSGELGTLANGKTILNFWLLGGLLGMGSVTTTLAAYETMIEDRMSGKTKDFFVSSMPRYRLAISYIISAIIIGFIMVCATLGIGVCFFYIADGVMISFSQIILSLLISFGNVMASATLFFPLVQVLKTRNAFGNFSILTGTLVGFLMGVYIPIGALPAFAQTLIRIFPITHGCALLRHLFTHELLQNAIPMPAIVDELESFFGITLSIQDYVLSIPQHVLVLLGTIVIFGGISLWGYHRHRQN